MSYKKQQPKLTDTLDVFIDRVEAINDSIKKLNHFNNELDQKVNAVQNLKLKVDLTELKNESSKINSSLNEISKDTISVFKREMDSFSKTVGKLSNFKINYIIYFFVILFIITTLSCFLTGKLLVEKNRQKELKEHYYDFILSNKEVLEIYKKQN
ncbi:hypothetical protein [Empedobacter sp.]|uniref:hypothetical protein n=1 Tax=Empedobacter sp. TaxID=1927715 RepID=UPI0028B237BC|nr:hypothetical protein [Empedobacter sp.]